MKTAQLMSKRERLASLYETDRRRLHNYLRRFVSPEDVEDLVQDTFLRALERLDSLKNPGALRSWLFLIGKTQALSILRNGRVGESRYPRREDVSSPEIFGLRDTSTPEAIVSLREEIEAFRERLEGLPFWERQAVILVDVHGLSYSKVAEILEAPINTIKSRVARGRAHIRGERGW